MYYLHPLTGVELLDDELYLPIHVMLVFLDETTKDLFHPLWNRTQNKGQVTSWTIQNLVALLFWGGRAGGEWVGWWEDKFIFITNYGFFSFNNWSLEQFKQTHTRTHTHTHTHTHTNMWACTRTRAYTRARAHTQTHMRARIHTHTYAYICARAHTPTHTHMRANTHTHTPNDVDDDVNDDADDNNDDNAGSYHSFGFFPNGRDCQDAVQSSVHIGANLKCAQQWWVPVFSHILTQTIRANSQQ